jgi:L,D-transpeptidase ErfK/SrfK
MIPLAGARQTARSRMTPSLPSRTALVLLGTILVTSSLGGNDLDSLSSLLTGGDFQHDVERGESLALLGSRYGVDTRELAAANHLNANAALKPGQMLKVNNRHIVPVVNEDVSLVINVPQRMLFMDDGERVSGYPVAVGRRDWPTPLGDFTIVVKEEQPTWDVPVSIQEEMRREGRPVVETVPPGPDNPLGSFWLGLSLGSIGIHGTNAPSSIFRTTTHGCIRMHPDYIRVLFPQLSPGTRGRIVYEPVLVARTSEGIFLEAHPDVYRRTKGDPLAAVRQIASFAGLTGEIDWTRAASVVNARRGIAEPIGIAAAPSP